MHYSIVAAFGNTIRLKLLCCLSKKRKNVQELVATCGLTQSAVSQHLTKLKQAGLVKDEKEGKYVYYSLVSPQAARLAHQLEKFIQEVGGNHEA